MKIIKDFISSDQVRLVLDKLHEYEWVETNEHNPWDWYENTIDLYLRINDDLSYSYWNKIGNYKNDDCLIISAHNYLHPVKVNDIVEIQDDSEYNWYNTKVLVVNKSDGDCRVDIWGKVIWRNQDDLQVVKEREIQIGDRVKVKDDTDYSWIKFIVKSDLWKGMFLLDETLYQINRHKDYLEVLKEEFEIGDTIEITNSHDKTAIWKQFIIERINDWKVFFNDDWIDTEYREEWVKLIQGIETKYKVWDLVRMNIDIIEWDWEYQKKFWDTIVKINKVPTNSTIYYECEDHPWFVISEHDINNKVFDGSSSADKYYVDKITVEEHIEATLGKQKYLISGWLIWYKIKEQYYEVIEPTPFDKWWTRDKRIPKDYISIATNKYWYSNSATPYIESDKETLNWLDTTIWIADKELTNIMKYKDSWITGCDSVSRTEVSEMIEEALQEVSEKDTETILNTNNKTMITIKDEANRIANEEFFDNKKEIKKFREVNTNMKVQLDILETAMTDIDSKRAKLNSLYNKYNDAFSYRHSNKMIESTEQYKEVQEFIREFMNNTVVSLWSKESEVKAFDVTEFFNK